jgi:hypothetical protein
LPYYLPKQDAQQYHVQSPDLLTRDRRDEWWQKYGKLKGTGYTQLPDNLKLKSLDEITAQPILNYLLAISPYFLQNKIDADTSRNEIYQSLLEGVYQRGWAQPNKANNSSQHPSIQEISFADFQLILEEVGLCAWHGDGRKVTEGEIIKHCENSSRKVQSLLACFSEQMQNSKEAKITRLMTAFYFQERGERVSDGEKTFEFTHKSFGEFLTAKRLVRAIREIDRKYRDEEDGWTKEQALKYWAEVCKSGSLDFDILEFFRQEVRLVYQTAADLVLSWQQTLCQGALLRQHNAPSSIVGG